MAMVMSNEENVEFVPPQHLAEAEARRDHAWREIQKIEAALANPNVTDPSTQQRMSRREFKQWRYDMVQALAFNRTLHRDLTAWIQQQTTGTLTQITDLTHKLLLAGVRDVIPEDREDLRRIVDDLIKLLGQFKPVMLVKSARPS